MPLHKKILRFKAFWGSLFWRTFLLLSLLVTASMATWFLSFKLVERKPHAQQVSAQIISLVTITRAALTHSAPDKRRELLIDLAQNQGIRVYALEDTDTVLPPQESSFFLTMSHLVRQKLGEDTRFAREMNGQEDFWVSFAIDNDPYWLRLDQERVNTETGLQFLGWIFASLVFTLIGAAFISKLINEPLSRISATAREIARGKIPQTLPESGPREIRETNMSFNQMVSDLARIESDRAVILAGISHDLRTPLTRMQLEIEMAHLSDDAREGMRADLSQMDAIINQFLDYAKPVDSITLTELSISDLLTQVCEEYKRQPDIHFNLMIADTTLIRGNETELRRLFYNLIENARRYGRNEDEELHLDLACHQSIDEVQNRIHISVRDHGNGVPESALDNLLRPFTRVNTARSQANGSGLGLAIVEKIVKRHQGHIAVRNHDEGGLLVSLNFPAADA